MAPTTTNHANDSGDAHTQTHRALPTTLQVGNPQDFKRLKHANSAGDPCSLATCRSLQGVKFFPFMGFAILEYTHDTLLRLVQRETRKNASPPFDTYP